MINRKLGYAVDQVGGNVIVTCKQPEWRQRVMATVYKFSPMGQIRIPPRSRTRSIGSFRVMYSFIDNHAVHERSLAQ
jgi:hypothetical protein